MLSLFCSHSWGHSDHRDSLHGLIHPYWRKNIDWRDLAVPEKHPLHVAGDRALAAQLTARIEISDVILAFAGVYASHSHWIEFEVQSAFNMRKPIVAIKPRGQERLSTVVMERASRVVGWQGRSVRDAVLACLPYGRWMELEAQLRRSEQLAYMAEIL